MRREKLRLPVKKLQIGLHGLYVLNIKRRPGNFFPTSLSIKLTDRCNYRCITCDEYKIGDKDKELNFSQLKKLIQDFKLLGGFSVRFTGGEPLIRKSDLLPLIKYSKEIGLKVSIATNGSLIGNEEIAFFKGQLIDNITVSLHGSQAVHDDYVGISGSWQRLDECIREMKNSGLPIGIAFTIIRKNMDDIVYIVEYASELGVKVSFNIFDTRLYFFKKIKKEGIEASIEQMMKVTDLLLDLKKKFPSHISLNEKTIREIPNLVKDSRLLHYFCARALMGIYVDSFGKVRPGCWAMPPVGSVVEKDLSTIYNSSAYTEYRKKGFLKQCSGCTCGFALDIKLNLMKRKIS